MTSLRKETKPLGDVHDGKCTFMAGEGEDRYIFKPRGAETEKAWERMLASYREAGFSLLPGAVEVIKELDGGHTERPVLHDKTTQDRLPFYFRRCGALIFFAYLLGSTDLHRENVIACGETPVPVDLETLLCGIPEREPEAAAGALSKTVYGSHLLPQFDGAEDISGISGGNSAGISGTGGQNLPITDNGAPFVPDHADDICAGFEEAYRFTMGHGQLAHECIAGFEDCFFRVILRPTETYEKIGKLLALLPEENRPAYALAMMRRAYERDIDPARAERAGRVIEEEASAVLKGEIPLFTVKGGGLVLRCRDEEVMPGFMRVSAVDNALSRLELLSDADLEKQLKLISLSYDALRPLGKERYEGERIASIEDCAVPGHPCLFIHITSDSSARSYFTSSGPGLYDGLGGILCCYAARYRRSGEGRLLGRMTELLHELEPFACGAPLALNDLNCQLGSGAAGVIAALMHVEKLTGLADAGRLAIAIAERFDPALLSAVKTDVLTGAGGLCLQLPKLPKDIALPVARALLPLFTETRPRLTGLAHGAAGQALCLGALGTVLGLDLNEKIKELLAWENAHFDGAEGNWRDLRGEGGFMGGWCSGAPGIGMARKRLASYTRDPEVLAVCADDIERSIRWLDIAPVSPRHTLCCGNAARLTAACLIGANESRFAEALASCRSAKSCGLLHPLGTADRNPGLMQGIAGVSYALDMRGDPLMGEFLI